MGDDDGNVSVVLDLEAGYVIPVVSEDNGALLGTGTDNALGIVYRSVEVRCVTMYEGQNFHPDCNDEDGLLAGEWSKYLGGLGQHWVYLYNCSVLHVFPASVPAVIRDSKSSAFLNVIWMLFPCSKNAHCSALRNTEGSERNIQSIATRLFVIKAQEQVL